MLRRYPDTGEPLACEPLDQGLLNHGYRVSTTRGSYFLKHHLDDSTGDRATIVRQHRATQRLQSLGVPVAPPVVDSEGDTVTEIGGRCYALHPWVDGLHRAGAQLTVAQSLRLGALLGAVHTGLEQVMEAGAGAGAGAGGRSCHASRDPSDTFALIDELLAAARGRRPGTPSTNWPNTGYLSGAPCWNSTRTAALPPRTVRRPAGCTVTSTR